MVTKFFRLGLNWSKIPCWQRNKYNKFIKCFYILKHSAAYISVYLTNKSLNHQTRFYTGQCQETDDIFMRATVAAKSNKVKLYLVDIFRHLVNFFSSRHFSAVRFVLSLCLSVSSLPPVVQRLKLYSWQKSSTRQKKLWGINVVLHNSKAHNHFRKYCHPLTYRTLLLQWKILLMNIFYINLHTITHKGKNNLIY